MARFVKRPVVIEAVKFYDSPESLEELLKFGLGKVIVDYSDPDTPLLKIHTLEGVMSAVEGDYIIKGVDGEFYPCKPKIFHKTYEQILD